MRRIAPMKINKIPKGKESMLPSLCSSGDYFAELKKDGYWYEFEKAKDGTCHLFSSNTSAVTGELVEKTGNVPHIIHALECLPNDTIIIGEIYYPGKTSKDVTPIMGSLPEKAVERQNDEFGLLHYYIHDIIFYNGTDLRDYGAWIRYQILAAVCKKYNLVNAYIELAAAVTDNIEDAIHSALEAGEEGMVLKKRTCIYHTGMRSPVWETVKVKKTDTCDAILIGYCKPTKYYDGKLDVYGKDAAEWPYWVIEQPDGTEQKVSKYIKGMTMPVTKAYYYDWITSIKIGAYDKDGKIKEIGTVSSGLTDELEEAFARHPEDYLNKVVELAGMEKNNKDRTLRHFFFKRFRDDKQANECSIEEIFS